LDKEELAANIVIPADQHEKGRKNCVRVQLKEKYIIFLFNRSAYPVPQSSFSFTYFSENIR
jgi:hypothetical protein